MSSIIQKQVIYRAIRDPLFGKDVLAQLPSNVFDENEHYKNLVIIIKKHYQTSNKALDESTLLTITEEHLVRQKKSLEVQESFNETIHDLYKIDELGIDEEAVGESIKRFVKKNLAAHLIKETLSKGEGLDNEETLEKLYTGIKEISILDINRSENTLFSFFDDVEAKKKMLQSIHQDKFSTGFTDLDVIAEGGIGRGELGLVIAPTGGGKTMWAVNQAKNYVAQGLNVLYVVLEERLERMILRFEQNMMGIPKSRLMPDNELDEEAFDKLQTIYDIKRKQGLGNLYIEKRMPQEVSPTMLEQIIVDASVRKGKHLDVVIIDYPDLMKNPHERDNSESRAGGKLYEEIRKLAQTYKFAGWVLSQVNRGGYSEDVLTAKSIEGSKQKLNAVEIAMTLNQKPIEFEKGFIRAYADKIRNNNGKSYNRMLSFKVVPETMTIRNITPDERVEHDMILNNLEEKEGRVFKNTKKATPDPQAVIDEVKALNSRL